MLDDGRLLLDNTFGLDTALYDLNGLLLVIQGTRIAFFTIFANDFFPLVLQANDIAHTLTVSANVSNPFIVARLEDDADDIAYRLTLEADDIAASIVVAV